MGKIIRGNFRQKSQAGSDHKGMIPITKLWMVTVPISAPPPLITLGTGFFLFHPTHKDDPHLGDVFLVTNKHVIHEDQKERKKVYEIVLGIHQASPKGIVLPADGLLTLRNSDGCRYKEHPSEDVDVLAIWVTDVFKNKRIIHSTLHSSLLATAEKIKEFDITAGDDVLVIGYPKGFRQGDSNLPIIRRGSLATQPGMTFIMEGKQADGRDKLYQGFLIDSISLPGASGSPVLLKASSNQSKKIAASLPQSPYPLLLGILAETIYFDIPETESQSITGFGLAFDAQMILETIAQFEKDEDLNTAF